VTALVSFNDKQLAKDAGFRWTPESKEWKKTVRAKTLADVEAMFAFKLSIKEVVK
jgi:hypothetical protein